MSDSDTIVCPECLSELITARYSTDIFVNEMVVEEYKHGNKYRYCECANHYLDGDFSDTLICEECGHTWEQPAWQEWNIYIPKGTEQ